MIDKPVYVVDIIGSLVQRVAAYKLGDKTLLQTIQDNETTIFGQTSIQGIDYQYGHVQELLETLSQMTKSPEESPKKYPLIWLVQDFTESINNDVGYYADVSLNVIIAHQTVNEYKITQRYDNVFKPVLYPIWQVFMECLKSQKGIQGYSPDCDKTDRSYWGSNPIDGNKGNVLTDYVDAIELQNLRLQINYDYC